ncbi:MFS transporter [Arenimonas aestuarii]
MPGRGTAAVWWLGLAQCVAWGVLYYGFPVWQLPMQARFGLSMAWVAAAYSAALLVAALVAPRVGRGFDRGHGAALFRLGLLAGVSGLLVLAYVQHPLALLLGWLGIGMGMALTLYETAFALVHRAISDPALRLQGLAAVTVMGGLASTVFLPLLGNLVEYTDLRTSLLTGAVAVLAAGWLVERRVLPALPAAPVDMSAPESHRPHSRGSITTLATIFTTGTVAGMALITLFVPLLLTRGINLAHAALVLAAFGVAQLPGRIWLLRGGRLPSVAVLTVWPMAMQAAGLVAAAFAHSTVVAGLGVALFGLGAGLHTLARPWLVQLRFGADAGHRNGQVAMSQGIGRALTPVASALAGALVQPHWILLALALVLLCLVPSARRLSAQALVHHGSDQGAAEEHQRGVVDPHQQLHQGSEGAIGAARRRLGQVQADGPASKDEQRSRNRAADQGAPPGHRAVGQEAV